MQTPIQSISGHFSGELDISHCIAEVVNRCKRPCVQTQYKTQIALYDFPNPAFFARNFGDKPRK